MNAYILSWPELVGSVHGDLLRRVAFAVSTCDPEWFCGHLDRMADRLEAGMVRLQAVLAQVGIDECCLDECIRVAETDPRFFFLYSLLRSAAFGNALGVTLEGCLYDSPSTDVPEITTLVNLFITLFDGLLDEAPTVFAAESKNFPRFLAAALRGKTTRIPSSPHPVLHLAYQIAGGWAFRMAEALPPDASLALDFSRAVRAAVRAENHSIKCIFDGAAPPDGLVRTLEGKSICAVWVQGLIPLCVRGVPVDLDLPAYRRTLRLLARYSGWLDDLRDLPDDLASHRWSTLLAFLHSHSLALGDLPPHGMERALISALGYEYVTESIMLETQSLYAALLEAAVAARVDSRDFRALVADMTQSFLGVSPAYSIDPRGLACGTWR